LLRRGFKSQCERRSTEIRKRLNLTPKCPLSGFALADDLGITVWSLEEIEDIQEQDFIQLTQNDPDSWSALTIRMRDNHLVVYNPAQSGGRVNSVVMHEISHIMLGHKLLAGELTSDGHLIPSQYDQEQEDEADWLAGTLLLPRPALMYVRKKGLSDAQIRKEYMVSEQMLLWRVRMTGVDYQIANSRRRSGK
jgi:Zn-dependent peptidase ImmA (M78 family)